MKLSIVIPCYNEAANLPGLVEKCAKSVTRDDIEVIFVDNGSTDDSPQVLAELLSGLSFARSIRVDKNQGYGFGILAGLEAAKGEILSWTHADLQTDPSDAVRGLEFYESSSSPERIFVKGRRYGRPLVDVVFTVGMSVFETILLRRGLNDINAQPTMFHRTFFQSWPQAPHDFSLDLFAYYQAKVRNLEVRRFPVLFAPRQHGQSHWNTDWKAKLKFIRRTVKYSIELHKNLGAMP